MSEKQDKVQVVDLYRYDVKAADSGTINVKFVAETAEGHKTFVEQLKALGVKQCLRSYVASFSVDRIMNIFENVIEEVEENEKKADTPE